MKCLIILALACASLAQAQDVSVSLGDLPPDKTVKVIYRTTVESTLPLGDSAISNQGTATTGAGTEHLTDDPSQVGAEQAAAHSSGVSLLVGEAAAVDGLEGTGRRGHTGEDGSTTRGSDLPAVEGPSCRAR